MLIFLIFFASVCFSERDPFNFQKTKAPLTSLVLTINYAKASDLAKFLTKNHDIVSPHGHIEADIRTNQLWITDDTTHIKSIQHIVHKLDVPVAEVLIKARIVSVDDNFVHTLGVIFGTELNQSMGGDAFTMDMPTRSGGGGVINFPIVKLGNGRLLDLELSALEQQGHAEVISSPELMVSNRQTAIIESGEEVPYQEKTGQGNTSVAFKKATLRLKVTPCIMPGKRILLHLTVNQDKISTLLINGVPAIRTQQLTTQVLVNNKDTIVLGGIYEQITSHQEEGVPGLRKIPIIGALFRQRHRVNERKQLLIFVTPRVMY